MYGTQAKQPEVALATALTYWVFRCRDKAKSPAMGIKTWEYLQSSIKNSAIPSRTLDDYIETLANKLIVPTLKPKEWSFVISPDIRIQRINNEGQIMEFFADQENLGLKFISWNDILTSLAPQGITDRKILGVCLKYPHIITTYTRVRYEEDKAIGQEEATDIEVETND